jgi:hypothetical protein
MKESIAWHYIAYPCTPSGICISAAMGQPCRQTNCWPKRLLMGRYQATGAHIGVGMAPTSASALGAAVDWVYFLLHHAADRLLAAHDWAEQAVPIKRLVSDNHGQTDLTEETLVTQDPQKPLSPTEEQLFAILGRLHVEILTLRNG